MDENKKIEGEIVNYEKATPTQKNQKNNFKYAAVGFLTGIGLTATTAVTAFGGNTINQTQTTTEYTNEDKNLNVKEYPDSISKKPLTIEQFKQEKGFNDYELENSVNVYVKKALRDDHWTPIQIMTVDIREEQPDMSEITGAFGDLERLDYADYYTYNVDDSRVIYVYQTQEGEYRIFDSPRDNEDMVYIGVHADDKDKTDETAYIDLFACEKLNSKGVWEPLGLSISGDTKNRVRSKTEYQGDERSVFVGTVVSYDRNWQIYYEEERKDENSDYVTTGNYVISFGDNIEEPPINKKYVFLEDFTYLDSMLKLKDNEEYVYLNQTKNKETGEWETISFYTSKVFTDNKKLSDDAKLVLAGIVKDPKLPFSIYQQEKKNLLGNWEKRGYFIGPDVPADDENTKYVFQGGSHNENNIKPDEGVTDESEMINKRPLDYLEEDSEKEKTVVEESPTINETYNNIPVVGGSVAPELVVEPTPEVVPQPVIPEPVAQPEKPAEINNSDAIPLADEGRSRR